MKHIYLLLLPEEQQSVNYWLVLPGYNSSDYCLLLLKQYRNKYITDRYSSELLFVTSRGVTNSKLICIFGTYWSFTVPLLIITALTKSVKNSTLLQ